MSKLIVDISMSLDGFIAGPNAAPENPLGDNGAILHEWLFDDPEVLKSLGKNTGAIIMGRRMYDESVKWWNGKGPLGETPCFVLTTQTTEPKGASSVFTFVNDGIESALKQAKHAAGKKYIGIGGGADVIQQYLKAGLVDEVNIHMAHVLLGGGTSLFGAVGHLIKLEKFAVEDKPKVTHFSYRVKNRKGGEENGKK